jgi:hypothetical protein
MFGLGYGGRSALRYVRLALLILILLAAVVFHGHGKAYDTIHAVYFVAVIGLLGFALFTRSASRRGRMGNGPMGPGSMGPGAMGPGSVGPGQQAPPMPGYGPGGWSTQGPEPMAQPVEAPLPPAGWYSEPGNPEHERYWDGRGWGPVRPRQGGGSFS